MYRRQIYKQQQANMSLAGTREKRFFTGVQVRGWKGAGIQGTREQRFLTGVQVRGGGERGG